jgi:hypothetical protein
LTIPKGSLEAVNGKPDNTSTKRKRTNNDLQSIKQKTKDRVTRTPLKTGCELRCPERQAVPVPYETPVLLQTAKYTQCTHEMIIQLLFLHEQFEDTKGVIRLRKSKNRQHNDQKEKRTK